MKGFKSLIGNKHREPSSENVDIDNSTNYSINENRFSEDEYKTVFIGRKDRDLSSCSNDNHNMVVEKKPLSKGKQSDVVNLQNTEEIKRGDTKHTYDRSFGEVNETVMLNGRKTNSTSNIGDKAYASLVYYEGRVLKKFLMKDILINIGRDLEICDLIATVDIYIGRNHALIYYKKGRFYIVDLSSKNGTYVNNMRIEGMAEIFDRDIIKFGKTEFKFFIH